MRDVTRVNLQRSKNLLDIIAPNNWHHLNPEADFMDTIKDVAALIDNILRKNAKASIGAITAQHYSSLKIPSLETDDTLKFVNKFEGNKELKIEWGKSILVSDINKPLDIDPADEKIIEAFENFYQANKTSFESNRETPFEKESLVKKASAVTAEENDVLVNALTDVLDTIALPNNRPTRLLQDYRGSSFSVRGYIKFVCSDGQYKKIYENLIGSPRKDYRVTLIVDVSQSMAGMAEIGATSLLISMAAALQNVEVLFSIMTSGSMTKLVKDFSEDWDNKTKAKLYDALTFDQDESNLSDSIFYGTQLINEGASPKVGKTIIVLTDGYPSAPKKLQTSLQYADSMGVQTIAIGVGYFTEGIFKYFPNFILADDPLLLPGAMQSFYLGEPQLEGITNVAGRIVAEKVLYNDKQLESMDDAWKMDIERVYAEEVDKTKKELRLVIYNAIQSSIQLKIKLCFVLDTTGSMTPYIEMAKDKIKQITENIKAHIADNCGKNTDLQVGFVAYKVRGTNGHLEKIPFTSDLQALQDFVNLQHADGGRGDEDKEDGILTALDFDWDGEAKFLVLIGDVPDYGTVGTMDQTIRRIAQQNIYILYVTIKPHRTNKECARLRGVYRSTVDSKINTKGFMEISMSAIGNDTNQLSEKIVDTVNTVINNEFM
ncbi:uncharacterized protein [Clytia hemisphaerica]|uniref:uncharacterized protein n=1 Tax=Clytia hemisphaerica TaxID=252671 RepID=UPI0034D54029